MNGTKQTNLHSLWDEGLFMRRLEQDFQNNASRYYEYIYQIMLNQSSSREINDDEDFNLEQLMQANVEIVCSQVYLDDNNVTMNASVPFNLGEIYYQRNIPIIEQRVAKGGRRLGVLLNQLARSRVQKPSNKKGKLSPSTIALTAILCTEAVLAIFVGIYIWMRSKKKSYSTSPSSIIAKN